MGNLFGAQPPASTAPLSQPEKEDIARRRVQYLETKYPPPKPIVTKRTLKNDEKTHESYLRDLRS
jgi:hypothetical protein